MYVAVVCGDVVVCRVTGVAVYGDVTVCVVVCIVAVRVVDYVYVGCDVGVQVFGCVGAVVAAVGCCCVDAGAVVNIVGVGVGVVVGCVVGYRGVIVAGTGSWDGVECVGIWWRCYCYWCCCC